MRTFFQKVCYNPADIYDECGVDLPGSCDNSPHSASGDTAKYMLLLMVAMIVIMTYNECYERGNHSMPIIMDVCNYYNYSVYIINFTAALILRHSLLVTGIICIRKNCISAPHAGQTSFPSLK